MPARNRSMGIKELADWLGASKSTVAQYVREGLGKEAGFNVGKQWRLMPLDVVAWLRDRPARKRRGEAISVQPQGAAAPVSGSDLVRLALARAGVSTPRKGGERGSDVKLKQRKPQRKEGVK